MSATEQVFRDKISQLQSQISECESRIKGREGCIPAFMVAAVATPFVLWLLLWFLQPRFVSKKVNDKYVKDPSKVFRYTLGITILTWIAMYVCYRYIDKNGLMICALRT